ncbi:hypothetical protein L596_013485 [Steinernema carpocapsae]|uniref:RING-type domain-containing protein n=1 Tax=Steinernema carpocapsae TaxID=34508 RepID=A0A4U5P0Z0_STECR|nr:hypothetical protein L596_013485 [Steinernema carpocapsae]
MSTFPRINCSICFGWLDGSSDAASTSCGHIFHKSCLSYWFSQSRTCPYCRRSSSEPRDVFFSTAPFDQNSCAEELLLALAANDLLQAKIDRLNNASPSVKVALLDIMNSAPAFWEKMVLNLVNKITDVLGSQIAP